MELRLLGPVELRVAGRPVPAGGTRQRSVLVALAVDAGGPVPAETLIDRVWGQVPPPRARHALHVYIARLRRLLAPAPALAGSAGSAEGGPVARVVLQDGGYRLEIAPECVDLHRFRRLAEQARDGGCRDPCRVVLLRRALELWRGPPLAELPGEWAVRVRQAWQQEYLEAVLGWVRACLRVGEPDRVLPRLAALTGEHPLVESLAAGYLRALYAAGRPADALAHYRTLQRALAEELGTDPGPELQELHRQVLTADPALPRPAASAPPPSPGPEPAPVPRHLPAPPQMFTGRSDELAELDHLPDGARAAVAVITGMAGVGKTALALHWAHRAADRFPDGQLYVNLRGFDPGGTPAPPASAVLGLLDGLGVPPHRIPAEPDAQAAQYRSRLAGQRMLVLLDNARDADQVRPLLPGVPGCLVLVTSRSQLTGLVATAGAHPVTLPLLSPVESRELLASRLGRSRVAAEPGPVEEIIARCGRLPLALAITAARAATHPGLALSALAADLRTGPGGGLDALETGDQLADVRAVFSWSYRHIGTGAARLFRLLGLHPGPDLTAPAAASLAGVPARSARRLLAELARAHLVTEPVAGRYALHDLLRAYATELVGGWDPAADRGEAVHRLLDHYLHTAYAAARVRQPLRRRFVPEPPRPGVVPEEPADQQQALAWLAAERPVLLAAVRLATATGHDRHAYQLAWCLTDFLDWRGHWQDWAAVQQVALEAAERLGDPAAEVLAHRGMAGAHFRLADYRTAYRHLLRALTLLDPATAAADRAGVHLNLASVCGRQGRPARALGHARQALRLYRAAGHRVGEGDALHAVGWAYALVGDHRRALAYGRRSLASAQRLGNREAEAATWESLGLAYQQLGDHAQAIDCYQHGLALCRALDNRYYEASGLVHLGDAQEATGDREAACRSWKQALEVLEDLGHPDADRVRGKLGLGESGPQRTP